MGKHKKMKPSQVGKNTLALADQIEAVKSKNRTKERNRHDNDDEFVNADLTKKILKAARTQQAELDDSLTGSSSGKHMQLSTSFEDTDSNDEDSLLNDDDLEPDTYCDTIEYNAEDDEIFKAFMSPNPQKIQTLADLVNENLSKKNTEVQSQFTDVGTLELQNLEPRVKEMYELVGEILKKYRSGKIPAAFKMIPHLQNWALILSITQPQSWSAAAMYEATRIFASNMKEKMAQRFYNVVLLPRVRDDIHEYKRLNHYIYQALRKALFKPGAFMKGIVLPLLEAGDCTLQEAKIIGSVLARNSVPILHSSVVLLKIAEMEYTGANSMFMHILFDKKYALPYRVVDAVVCHFLRFAAYPRPLPVLWHQTLLTFVQRYKADISTEQRDALLELLKKKTHSSITQEVRKELQAAQCRDIEVNEKNLESCMLVE